MYSIPALLVVATGALIYAFVNNDFSVRYVAENSSLAMPREYTWVAFYAGNAGSMLYLAVIFALMAVVAIATIRKNLPYTSPYAVGIMALSLAFLLGVMLFLANPLARLEVTPMDGEGINPLLVHFGMFIHPPLQMAGLVSVAIPFSIAMGAMLANKGGNDEWVDQGRLWGMISWLVLTAGLLLGSWWAYTILGWGGYWAWDPVENSALMPWLAMTAFVHLDHGAEAARYVPNVEHGDNHHRVHDGSARDVHQPRRAGAVGAFFRGSPRWAGCSWRSWRQR